MLRDFELLLATTVVGSLLLSSLASIRIDLLRRFYDWATVIFYSELYSGLISHRAVNRAVLLAKGRNT